MWWCLLRKRLHDNNINFRFVLQKKLFALFDSKFSIYRSNSGKHFIFLYSRPDRPKKKFIVKLGFYDFWAFLFKFCNECVFFYCYDVRYRFWASSFKFFEHDNSKWIADWKVQIKSVNSFTYFVVHFRISCYSSCLLRNKLEVYFFHFYGFTRFSHRDMHLFYKRKPTFFA
jgi:hypothetical protein